MYEAGYSPICPILLTARFLQDAVPQEHKDGIDMARDYLRHSRVLVVCGRTVDETVKQLIGQNQGVSNIELTDPSTREFDRIARKYGVDYAIKRDRSSDPPKFLVFFKSRDADALTSAFNEYAGKKVKKASWPSVLQRLARFKELVKNTVVNREKRRELER